jgi:hypothetical protein
MISFRISDEEYEYLRKISLNQGTRSISDYARSALIRADADCGLPECSHALKAKVVQLDDELHELKATVQRLTGSVSVEEQCAS